MARDEGDSRNYKTFLIFSDLRESRRRRDMGVSEMDSAGGGR